MTWYKTLKLCILLCTCASITSYAQEDLSVFGYWKYYEGTPANSLYKHLSSRAFQQINTRNKEIEKLKTKADWQERQKEIQNKLLKIVGTFPEKTPLNPVITGTIQKPDFKVEKLHFESRPGYLVTAALFLPEKRDQKLPAIVYCSGHSDNGFRSDAYQRIILNYVKKGFAVLAFDPIGQGERKQYFEGVVGNSATSEHSYPGAQSFISGLSPANYFIWDGIRAVDYLYTRKEIDPARIGIAGRSGGATQAAYIAAMDDRILASAPECYITTFEKQLKSKGPQDAEQNLLYGLENGIDITDYLVARAPKPTLLVTTTNDIFSIQGARDAFREAREAYSAFGKTNHMNMVEDDAGHISTPKNRIASYTFFQKYLNNPGSPDDLEVDLFPEQELYVFPDGRMPADKETLFSLTQKRTQSILAEKNQDRTQNPTYEKSLRAKIQAIIGYEQPKAGSEVIFSGRIHRKNYTIEKYLVKGSSDYHVPVLWMKPKNGNKKRILLLDERGKALAGQEGELADQLACEGHEVILADLSGFGALSSGYLSGGDSVIDKVPLNLWFTGILTHQSLVAVRAEEIFILTDFINTNDTESKPITALAQGTITADLMHAAALHHQAFDQVILLNPLISYASILEQKNYKTKFIPSAVAASIRHYDLPDLAALYAGKLLIINPLNALDMPISLTAAQLAYAKALNPKTSTTQLKLEVNIKDLSPTILNWLK